MIREPCRYRGTAMMSLRVLLDWPAAMSTAKIVEPYREPTPPLMGATRLRKGERLTPLALMPQAPRPVMTRHPTGITRLLTP